MARTLSASQSTILDIVRQGGRPTIATLSVRTGLADASVRRDIQALRKAGHNIVCNNDGDYYGGPTYSLVEAPVTGVVHRAGTEVAL